MILFWKGLVILIMVVFFPVAFIVAVKGFRDLVLMLTDLGEDHENEESPDS